MGLFNFLGDAKSTFLGLLVIGIISYVGFYVYGLKSEIEDLNNDKTTLTLSLSEAEKTIVIKEVKIVVLEGTVKELSNKLDEQNINIKNMELDSKQLNEDIVKLKQQEPSVQYVVKTKSVTCDDLQQLVKKIGGLSYENF